MQDAGGQGQLGVEALVEALELRDDVDEHDERRAPSIIASSTTGYTEAEMAFFFRDRFRRRYCTKRRSTPSRLPLRSPATRLAERIGG